MEEKISIWHVGNTGLRSPDRIQDGLRVFAQSPYIGNLHGNENEVGFMNYLDEKGIIQNAEGKDASGSHARKWRLMFARHGFIYPQINKSTGFHQSDLGELDDLTPFGRAFLQADTFPAVQECFLRASSVEQYEMPDGSGYYSPLRWILAIMLELERRTGSTELTRIEFALWGHTTNPSYDVDDVVDQILDLRSRRRAAQAKNRFDQQEIAKRGEHYDKKNSNFYEYSDMNMRYLRITGVLQRKGRGLMIVPAKHLLAQQLAKTTPSTASLLDTLTMLCNGAPLPSDEPEIAMAILQDLQHQLQERHIVYDISDLPLTSAAEINIARQRLENILSQTNELIYAAEQRNKWREISDYMSLLIRGGGKIEYDEDTVIEVPKEEAAAYLEWTLWRAALAIDHLANKPYEVRGFRLDSDFMHVSTAGGGKGDLYCEFENFTILTEVTMSTSSRQEAMEGEPVRRHVSDAVLNYQKPVYGMFIPVKIDTNTAETFRHGVWYAQGEQRQRLNIVPISLAQFQKYFCMMFETEEANPEKLVELIQTKYPLKPLSEVCTSLIAGGDVPNNWSEKPTEENTVPIYSNGAGDKSLYGFTNIPRILDDSVTISGRGTIGYTAIRKAPFYPVVRLIVATPDESIVKLRYLYEVLAALGFQKAGKTIPQLTVPMVQEKKIPVPPILIQQQIIDECAKNDEEYNTIRMSIDTYRQKIEELFAELDVGKSTYNSRLSRSDTEKFSVSIGKRVLDKELVPGGTIPVYSANVTEPFGFIDKLLITDFSVPSVLWGIDGDWMTSYIPEGKEFYPTDHCGVLRCKIPEVNPRYLVHILEVEGKKMGFSRSYRASIDRVQGITFSVPDIVIQNEAMRKVFDLEESIKAAEEKLAGLNAKRAEIIKSYL